MRPDQHKKRKNAEYKKKHGMPQQKKNNDNMESGQTHEKTSHEDKHLKPRNKPSDSDEEPEEGEKNDHEQRRFSRRQMESNWDRYKDDEQGEESEPNVLPTVTKIGVDFQVLLDKTVGQTSQFHFESEKEWEDLKADEANCKVGSDLMSIDCSSLVLALREIPLDRRLEIDKKYFEDEKLNVNHSHPTSLPNNNLKPQINNTEMLKQTNFQRNFNFSKPNESSKQLKEKENDPMVQDLSLSTTQKLQPDTSHTQNTNCMVDEVDLDQLLGLGTKQGKSDTGVENIHQNKKYTDHVPVPSTVIVTKDNTIMDTVPKLSKPPQETKEDLEDWLDSILD